MHAAPGSTAGGVNPLDHIFQNSARRSSTAAAEHQLHVFGPPHPFALPTPTPHPIRPTPSLTQRCPWRTLRRRGLAGPSRWPWPCRQTTPCLPQRCASSSGEGPPPVRAAFGRALRPQGMQGLAGGRIKAAGHVGRKPFGWDKGPWTATQDKRLLWVQRRSDVAASLALPATLPCLPKPPPPLLLARPSSPYRPPPAAG